MTQPSKTTLTEKSGHAGGGFLLQHIVIRHAVAQRDTKYASKESNRESDKPVVLGCIQGRGFEGIQKSAYHPCLEHIYFCVCS
ncbi:hypothetical protein DPMN_117145 [Dreissena polymorpha]|uniref:Uncharacterized protein n=1 Tax=Dreissena polymorpha TaxID=45954 RepID=A0A9D4KPU8_DREPO|nr:hypothetical protein DPMN_117145 [Dreissena polymorpha]